MLDAGCWMLVAAELVTGEIGFELTSAYTMVMSTTSINNIITTDTNRIECILGIVLYILINISKRDYFVAVLLVMTGDCHRERSEAIS